MQRDLVDAFGDIGECHYSHGSLFYDHVLGPVEVVKEKIIAVILGSCR